MWKEDTDFDITKNIKIVEWLKSELLTAVASLHEILVGGVKDKQDVVADVIANIILVTYLLGRRLGISFDRIDYKVEDKIRIGITEEHNVEKWYGELTEMREYLKKTRR